MTHKDSFMMRALSLRMRITLLLAAAIVLILGTATWLIDSRIDTELSQRADANLLERAQALADIFRVQRDNLAPDRLPEFLADDGRAYFSIECAGRTVASNAARMRLAWPVAAARPQFANMQDPHGNGLRAVAVRFGPLAASAAAPPGNVLADMPCVVRLALDEGEVQRFQSSMDAIFIGSSMIAILVGVILVPLLVSRGLRPLSQLAEAMHGIGPQTPERRLAGKYVHELTPLTRRLNEGLSRRQAGLGRERQFASGVAHELRTPLAELRTMVEVELRYPSGRDLRALLADIGSIGMEMERMVGALLLLTRIEAGIEQVQTRAVDVAALTHKLVERYRHDIERRRLQLDLQVMPNVCWPGDIALLEVLMGNLLSNAVAYAPAGSVVTLRCDARSWCVGNVAADLNEEEVALMGQRFWRKGKDAGVPAGLGLALAAAAARIQHIQLTLALEAGQLAASVAPQGSHPLLPSGAVPAT